MADEPTENVLERRERMRKTDQHLKILVILMFFGLLALMGVIARLDFLGNLRGIILFLLPIPLFFLGHVWFSWDEQAGVREAARVADEEWKERQGERKKKYGPPVDSSKAMEWEHTTVTLEPGDLEKYGDGPPVYEEDDDTGPPYPPLRRVKKEDDTVETDKTDKTDKGYDIPF